MAGDSPTEVTEIQLIDVEALMHKVESQTDLLQQILDTARFANRSRSVIELHAVTAALTNTYVNHTRFFLEYIIFTGHDFTANGIWLVLNVGAHTYRFHYDSSLPLSIPFPIVLDRGVDVFANFLAAAGSAAELTADLYLIGTVE
jgi:hypothetical protein